MTAPSLARTSVEVAGLRAEAEWKLAEHGGDPYMAVTMQAVIDTLDWLAGHGPAPISGPELAADEYGVELEETRAFDAERAASGEAMWRPGRVAVTLAYLAGDPTAESPV
jgi:hypothetical protein